MHQYIPPPADLAAVDPRFALLSPTEQQRVVTVMLTAWRIPMSLAVDAVLATDNERTNEDDNRR